MKEPWYKDKKRGTWVLDVSAKKAPTGKRYRKDLPTATACKSRWREIQEEHRKHGISGTLLNPDIAAQADKAVKLLEPYGVSLLEAAERIVKLEKQKAKSCTFAELFDAYQCRETARERREATLANWNNTYNQYENLFGNKLISEIDKEKIRKHMRKFTLSAQGNHFRHLRSWFNYAVKREWMDENPMLKLDMPEHEKGETRLLTNKQCRDLLNAAAKDWPELLPYAALGIFAGIRPAEIGRLRWDNINVTDRIIIVTSTTAKTRRRAGVKLNDTLYAWLKGHVKESGAIVPLPEKTFQRHWYACRESVGLYKVGAGLEGNKELWPFDAMRHTFASNHYAAFKNIAELQVEMRHTGNARTLNEHYLSVVTKKDALAFWKIVPKGAKAPKLIKQVS